MHSSELGLRRDFPPLLAFGPGERLAGPFERAGHVHG